MGGNKGGSHRDEKWGRCQRVGLLVTTSSRPGSGPGLMSMCLCHTPQTPPRRSLRTGTMTSSRPLSSASEPGESGLALGPHLNGWEVWWLGVAGPVGRTMGFWIALANSVW